MQEAFPVSYIEPVFRPPSEAHSLILPVTNGCSWNKFRARDEAEVLDEIRRVGERYIVNRIFLADGDAMVLPTHRLLRILEAIAEHIPSVERVTSYCLPRNLKRKSVEELKELREVGLAMLYVGAESGDDEVLERVNKGETAASTADALIKAGEAGLKRSVMILNGLGGLSLSKQHALNSAKLLNQTQPEFVSTLVVSFPQGMERFRERYPDFVELNQQQLFSELRQFVAELALDNSTFRSDHASNALVLKGELGQDKDRLLAQIDHAISRPDQAGLRPEWMRGL
tara:strand:- start:250 stop:1104 length:855 start_codon:yes stop_codon:yes gene_type:complete